MVLNRQSVWWKNMRTWWCVKTTSKSRSLAGLRVGFAIAQPHLIAALEAVKNSFNSYPMDRFAIAAAVASFEDRAYFEHKIKK